MIEVGSCNGLANTWPNLAGCHCGAPRWLLVLLRVLGKGLRAAILLTAGICPLYAAFDVVLREFHQPQDPVSWMALIGIGVSFIYFPFYLTCPLGRRFSITTGLLIGFGLVAGLVGVWISR